ncbi:hypothetical protein [Leucobacter sp. NPDC077196]|uniref:hypothetical protein n=1 Tax=Leucobacter sp. NPDC077196 TaxID=3154959 RepID=UPI00341E0C48
MQSLKRKVALRAQAAAAREAALTSARVGRTTQVAHSTVAVGDDDVPVVEAVEDARETAGEFPSVVESVDAAAEDAFEASMNVGDALTAANEAATIAADAKTTADGKNSRRRGQTEPAPPAGGWQQGDQWVVDNAEGVPVEVRVWDGDSFEREQLLASEILVLSEGGTVRIADGAITSPMLSVGALDFKTARGLEVQGGRIVGGTFELADLVSVTVLDSDPAESLARWSAFDQAPWQIV